jgi:hypothetical protein
MRPAIHTFIEAAKVIGIGLGAWLALADLLASDAAADQKSSIAVPDRVRHGGLQSRRARDFC